MKIALGLMLVGLAIALAFGGDPDDDGDGVPNDEDCRPDDPNLWGAPAAGVTDLTLGRPTATLTWSRPPDLGCVPGFERYDALASGDVTDFGYPHGFCAEINTSNFSATDERLLEPGAAAFYLVRVENECGLGPLDSDPPPVALRVADYLEVTNLNDDGPGSLRAAIAAAAGGEAICFEPTGTLALTSGPVSVDKNVAIAGPGASWLTIDGGGSSVLRVLAPASISDLTVSGGGVGVDISGVSVADVAITTSTIQGNAVGIGVTYSYLTIDRTTIVGNSSAGLYADYSYPVITSSTIQGNTVGIELTDSAATIDRTTIVGNSSAGLYAYDSYPVIITSSTIRDNGTGIAISGYYSYETEVISSTIAGNDVGFLGANESFSRIWHTTIADNDVGVREEAAQWLWMGNSIVSNPVNCVGAVLEWGPNLIDDDDPSCSGVYADPLLGPLGDHGGPTASFPLMPGSPAIDAGLCSDPSYPRVAVSADQRGFRRPVDQPELPNAFDGCDIGAYEVQSEFACDCQSTADCDFPDTCYAGCVCRYEPFCGSGICDPEEDGVSCPEDCPAVCGNGLVEPGEECEVFHDCGLCPIGQVPVCTDCQCDCVPR